MKTELFEDKAIAKTATSDQKESRCDPEDEGGLFFVIQALLSGEEPFNAMVLVTDAQLEEVDKAHARVPHLDKREVMSVFILRGLGLPGDQVLGAKCTVAAFENEAEARSALAHNEATTAEFARLASGSPPHQPGCFLN